ncbi:MAG: GNAT family N-acetyltransferase [Alphaproteobacteria bacterium]|nr:GNAT family N-acetyltransferase [Alphaproteobacteria bacterium]
MDIPTLETERLILRPFKADDIDAYAAMVADTEVSKFISLGGKPMDRLEAWRSMTAIVGHWHLRGYGQWVVEEKETSLFVGRMGLYYPDTWPGQELGYALERSHWGKGYATEGAIAARDYAFKTLGWDDIISIISPVNIRSKAVAERLGETYREELILKDMTLHIYGLTRADWEKLDR